MTRVREAGKARVESRVARWQLNHRLDGDKVDLEVEGGLYRKEPRETKACDKIKFLAFLVLVWVVELLLVLVKLLVGFRIRATIGREDARGGESNGGIPRRLRVLGALDAFPRPMVGKAARNTRRFRSCIHAGGSGGDRANAGGAQQPGMEREQEFDTDDCLSNKKRWDGRGAGGRESYYTHP